MPAANDSKRRGLLVLQLLAILSGFAVTSHAQQDGGISYDNRGQELLESLSIPPIAHAPFSLLLATEWVSPHEQRRLCLLETANASSLQSP